MVWVVWPLPSSSRPFPSFRQALPFALIISACLGWLAFAYLTADYFIFFANGPGLLMGLWCGRGGARAWGGEEASRA